MALTFSGLWMRHVAALRVEPTYKRIRASSGGIAVADSTRAVLVWEPHRILPSYAVPLGDLQAGVTLVPAEAGQRVEPRLAPLVPGGPPVLGHAPFGVHTAPGEALTVRCGDREWPGAAFRLADPELAGSVVLDFDAFDTWLEEDEVVGGHPRDPYHRVDVRRSSRHVRVEFEGACIAESREPMVVFETKLRPRLYLPREALRAECFEPSRSTTVCAYKGTASYLHLVRGDRRVEDVAWSYPAPLPEAVELAGRWSFYEDRVEVYVDGRRDPWG